MFCLWKTQTNTPIYMDFFIIYVGELFMYSKYKSWVRNTYIKYLLTVCGFSLYVLKCDFWWFIISMEYNISIFKFYILSLVCLLWASLGSDGKEFACNVGYLDSVSGLGRSPGEGNSYPLQYSGLKNSMGREAWQATVHGVTKSQTGLSYTKAVKTTFMLYSK